MIRAKSAGSCAFAEARAALLDSLDADADTGVRLVCAHLLRAGELSASEKDLVTAHLERERSPLVRLELMRLLGWIDEPPEKKP
jgi:hypothetical protein